MCPSAFITCPSKLFYSCPFTPRKITNFQCEWCHVLLFTFSVILQGCHCVIDGRNIDINKVEAIVGMQHFFWVVKKIILQFGFICCWRMSWKFFLCSCHKYLLINFFSFGVVNNVPLHQINSRHKHIITLRILGSKHDKVCQKKILNLFYFRNNLFSTFTFKKILKTYLSCILKS